VRPVSRGVLVGHRLVGANPVAVLVRGLLRLASSTMQRDQSSISGTRRAPESHPHALRTPSRDHAALAMFVGHWRVDGRNAGAAPNAPNALVAGEQVYEWLAGGFFVVGRWSRRFGDDAHIGTSVLGHEPDDDAYFAHHYDNLGYAREYVVSMRDRVWTFTGRYERATIAFSSDGASFDEVWELSKDGMTWHPLCELSGRRGR